MFKTSTIKTLPETDISIAEKVTALKQPETYLHRVEKVETKETHMSWIFLVNKFAYKLKKPVQYRFLDLRTIEARFKNCTEEIRLNKRLAKNIYTAIVPLVLNEEGKMQVEGKGAIIDWLVKMKRISDKNMLDHAILHQRAHKTTIEKTARLLAEFYRSSPPIPMNAAAYKKKLKDEITFPFTELLQPVFNLPVKTIERIYSTLVRFLNSHGPLFETRITRGAIIEAHGDLRPEHICMSPQPAIIDALEFNKELRIMDVAEELSFLDMECEMMGDTDSGKIFFECYTKLSHDDVAEELIFFYKAKKALLRTYLVARHITEPGYRKETKWMKKASKYLQLSQKYSSLLTG